MKQNLWFIGLYFAGVAALFAAAGLVKLLLMVI